MEFTHRIHVAVINDNTKLIANLLDDRSLDLLNDFEQSYTPLLLSIHKDRYIIADMLISRGADLRFGLEPDTTSIQYAIKQGKYAILDLLLSKASKTIVNKQDRNGWNALHLCANNDYNALYILLKNVKKVDLYRFTDLGLSCMDLVMNNEDTESASLLIDAGYEISGYNGLGETILHRTVASGYNQGVRFALHHGANVNAMNLFDNATPLHIAAEKGHLTLVEILIQANANKNLKNKAGRTPLQIAVRKGHAAVTNKLM